MNRDQAKEEVENVLDRREPRYHELHPQEKELVEMILEPERGLTSRAERVVRAIDNHAHAQMYTTIYVEKLCAIIEKLSR